MTPLTYHQKRTLLWMGEKPTQRFYPSGHQWATLKALHSRLLVYQASFHANGKPASYLLNERGERIAAGLLDMERNPRPITRRPLIA